MGGQIWHRGQIDALALPNGTFISSELTRRRVETLRGNTSYRESIEKACKIAGYVDPALSLARGRVSSRDARSLFKQNEKAERLMKEKKNDPSIISSCDVV